MVLSTRSCDPGLPVTYLSKYTLENVLCKWLIFCPAAGEAGLPFRLACLAASDFARFYILIKALLEYSREIG